MYSYILEILGMGCEIVACELTEKEISGLKKVMKETNTPLEDIFKDTEKLRETGLGVDSWYELDDICHVYGAYPNMSRVRVKNEDSVQIYNSTELRTFVDDFYSLTEFDSIHSVMDEKGVLVKSCLITKEPFDPDLLTLLITKLEKHEGPIYVVTGFVYGDEYLKLEKTLTEELSIKTFINKTTDNPCIIY